MKFVKPEPKNETHLNFSFRIDSSLLAQLKKECDKAEITVAEGMRQLIVDFLKKGK